MRTILDPPLNLWRVRQGAPVISRDLLDLINRHSRVMGAAVDYRGAPVIATGHQAFLWHPGILAKDLAVTAAAQRLGAGALHVVVDHDVHDPLSLDLPIVNDGRLGIERVTLAATDPRLPAGCQPPVPRDHLVKSLRQTRDHLGSSLTVDLSPLIDAAEQLPDSPTLAHQVTAWLTHLKRPYCGPMPVVFASHLLATAPGHRLVARMLDDARRCVDIYNQATRAHPSAGIAPLTVEPDRVELPLWAVRMGQPRLRVYADLAAVHRLTLPDGERLNETSWRLAPRAILLTAFMRHVCDLFVHGTGALPYERAMEQWWRQWTGEELAPMAVASADLFLPFTVPVADRNQLDQAVWWRHHLPHNLDQLLAARSATPPVTQLIQRKRELLSHMPDDRDRSRRAAAFDEIQRINHQLAAAHPAAITEADARLHRARLGVANRAVAAKRDWCFALYPPSQLHSLAKSIGVQ